MNCEGAGVVACGLGRPLLDEASSMDDHVRLNAENWEEKMESIYYVICLIVDRVSVLCIFGTLPNATTGGA